MFSYHGTSFQQCLPDGSRDSQRLLKFKNKVREGGRVVGITHQAGLVLAPVLPITS